MTGYGVGAPRSLRRATEPHTYPRTPRILHPAPQVYVRKRPYLDKFLAWASARFEVVIFTASQQVRTVTVVCVCVCVCVGGGVAAFREDRECPRRLSTVFCVQ